MAFNISDLRDLITKRDVPALRAYMAEYNLVVKGGKIVPKDEQTAKTFKTQSEFWNQRQQARKILLNSLYGALLNEAMRFADERLGQSVTLTGRSIVRHMNAKTNEVIAGEYNYTGPAIVYADTDSCYFSAAPMLKEKEEYANFAWDRAAMVEFYDAVADTVNDSFPEFMHKTFNATLKRGGIIKAGRELVASKGLFIKKKKYAVLMYDKEGTRLDTGNKPGKLKAMGLDLKRADTPKFMQVFLENALMDLLQGSGKNEIFADVKEFRNAFKERPAWEKGSPKKVSGLSQYGDKLTASRKIDLLKNLGGGKVNMPGHVRASLNWNALCEVYGDKYSMRISDGTRIVVCKLKPNANRIDSIAYPIDELQLPQWFKELPFDHDAMEETIIDNKLTNLLEPLEWDLEDSKDKAGDDFISFGKGK